MDPGSHHPSTYHHHHPFSPGNSAGGGGGGDALLILAIPAGWLVGLSAFLCSRALSAALGLLVLPAASLVGVLRRAAPSLARRALAAALTFAALAAALAASLLLGFVLVRRCVEGPVTLRQPLYFDYTEPQPSAAVALAGAPLPAGHSVRVSVALLLPDSDHNRQIGVFQIKAEAIAASGIPVATATQPYMLRYKSGAVRLAQSALAIVPLAMGVRSESQSANLRLLQYREEGQKKRKTGLVRVSLQPRAMTVDLPQVYSAEVLVQTALPWSKALARGFRWTLCVWLSACAYVLLSSVIAVCTWVRWRPADRRRVGDRKAVAGLGGRDDDRVVRWRERRGRRQPRIHGGRDELPKLDQGSASAAAVAGAADEESIGDLGEPFAQSSSSEFI